MIDVFSFSLGFSIGMLVTLLVMIEKFKVEIKMRKEKNRELEDGKDKS